MIFDFGEASGALTVGYLPIEYNIEYTCRFTDLKGTG